MTDPIRTLLAGPSPLNDIRLWSRMPCILTTPPHTRWETLAIEEWMACTEWLSATDRTALDADIIDPMMTVGDHLLSQLPSYDGPQSLTDRFAHLEVYGQINRVPIYGVLVHLAVTRPFPEIRDQLLPLAAQILLAYAITIYQDDGPRLELCGDSIAKKPPIPSAILACRLFRQAAKGLHPELLQELPTERVALSESYGQLEESFAHIQGVRILLQDARDLRGRRQSERRTATPASPEEKDTTPPPLDPQSETPGEPQRPSSPDGPKTKREGSRGKSVGGTIEIPSSPLTPTQLREFRYHGLALDEVRPIRQLMLATAATAGNATPGASLSTRTRCEQGMLLDRARANQHLPIGRRVVRDGELVRLVEWLAPWMHPSVDAGPPRDPVELEAIAMVTLILIAGATPEDLLHIPVVRDEDRIGAGMDRALIGVSDTNSKTFIHLWVRAAKPEMDPDRYASVASALVPTSEGLHLPLPPAITSLLLRVRQEAQETKRPAMFGQRLNAITHCIRNRLQVLNNRYQCQMRLSDLPRVLPQRIQNITGNPSYAWLIGGEGDPHRHTQLVYQTTHAGSLIDAYHEALDQIFGSCTAWDVSASRDTPALHPDRHYGSALRPKSVEVWRALTDELRLAIPRPPATNERSTAYVEHHNAYVLYVLWMVLLGTGIRAIRDPVESSLDVDWENRLLYVQDKEARAYANERLIPLAPTLHQQLRAYRSHLQAFATVMECRDEDLSRLLRAAESGDDPSVPFLHLLDPHDLTVRSIGPSVIEQCLIDTFPVPSNIGRHHMRSYLAHNGCPNEWIDALLGHEATGMEAFGPYSALSTSDMRRISDQWIEPMLQDQGWFVIKGMRI